MPAIFSPAAVVALAFTVIEVSMTALTLPAGISREPIDPRDKWIVDANRNPIGLARFDGTELYFEQPDKTRSGSPVGQIVPDFIGQQVYDSASGIMWLGILPVSGGWVMMSQGVAVTPNSVSAATANAAAINAALWSNGTAIVQGGLGTVYHDRSIEPPPYSTLIVQPGTKLKLAPGASCPQVRDYWSQNPIDATTFISVSGGVATIIEKGHNRSVGDQVYIENVLGNTTLGGLKTITEVGTNGSGFRYWKCACSDNTALTNNTFQRVFVMRYNPLSGAAFSRVANSATVTISNASPGVITWTSHTFKRGDPIFFTTSGGLPTGLTAGTTYYVLDILTANTFTVSATPYGAAINTSSAGSGTHTGYGYGTVTVTQAGHKMQVGDSPYITAIPVVTDTFNGSVIVTDVVPGVSWSFKQMGRTETGTGTATIQYATGMKWDLACLDYDAANNLFDQNWAVNAWIGNVGNSEFWFHQNIDGRTRSVQIFNGGDGVFIHKHIAASNSGASCKGTLQIEAYGGHLNIGTSQQVGGTDDNVAWGQTAQVTPYGGTATPSGPLLRLGKLTVQKAIGGAGAGGTGASIKVFSITDYTDLGDIYCADLDGTGGNGLVIIGHTATPTATIRSLHVGKIHNVPTAGQSQIYATNMLRVESFRVDHLVDKQWQTTKYTVSSDTTTFGHFHIGTLTMAQNRASEIGILFGAGTVIENLSQDSAHVQSQSGFNAYRVQSTAVVQNANMRGTRYVASSIFVGDFIACNSGGTIQNLNVSDYRGNNRSVYAAGSSGSATAAKLKFTDVTCAGLVNDGGTSQSGTIYLSNVEQATNGANMLSLTGSGTWRVEGGANVTHQTGFFCALSSGTVTVGINCPGARIDVDPAVSTRLSPAAGDVVYNTNTALGTLAQAGPVIRRGSDSKWVLMADTTKTS